MSVSIFKPQLSVRAATQEDRQSLANLIHFETRVHRHLDWRGPLDWLGFSPYLILEQRNKIIATLACPSDPDHIAWIRLFAVAQGQSIKQAWEVLWPEAKMILEKSPGIEKVASLPLQTWFVELLQVTAFTEIDQVVMLSCDLDALRLQPVSHEVMVRLMNFDDIFAVERVDHAAFEPIWHNSLSSLQLAYSQASLATVAEIQGDIVGYQISTATPLGAHLSRLAVLPEYQNRSIGYCLLRDLLLYYKARGALKMTVNTQKTNSASLHLYQKVGFRLTGEQYPVYVHLIL